MASGRIRLVRGAFDALHAVRAHRWLAPLARGRGAIFMLHHVRPWSGGSFCPNRHLEVTPEFLDETLTLLRRIGFAFVSMDEVAERLKEPRPGPPFAAFTLDDGYRDNAVHAAPLFRRHGAPYTIYVASDFARGRGILWWVVAERAIRAGQDLRLATASGEQRLETSGLAAQAAAFRAVYLAMLSGGEESRQSIARNLASQAGFEAEDVCRDLCMAWDEIAALAADPLLTVGAHTRSHPILASVDDATLLDEIAGGRSEIESRLGRRVAHFAYPVGNAAAAGEREFVAIRDLGFDTGVTTRRGHLFTRHRDRLAALPRVSLNGFFQARRYVELFSSGVPFLLS